MNAEKQKRFWAKRCCGERKHQAEIAMSLDNQDDNIFEQHKRAKEQCRQCQTRTAYCTHCTTNYCPQCSTHCKDVCHLLKQSVEMQEFVSREPYRVNPVYIPPSVNQEYVSYDGWDNYMSERCSATLRDGYSRLAVVSDNWKHGLKEWNPMHQAIATDNLSFPLTIVYALEKVFGSDQLSRQKRLEIHVIGASMIPELVGTIKYEEILLLLPNLQSLKLAMVGPDMRDVPEYSEDTLCRRLLSFEHVHGPYHEIMNKKTNTLKSPDMAIAFNCGIHEDPKSWLPTISYLVERGIPTAFTSFNEWEAINDAGLATMSSNAKLICRPSKNPFASKLLYQDVSEWSVFSRNAYISIFHNERHTTSPAQSNDARCLQCGKNEEESKNHKLLRCSACKHAIYCSSECQLTHWKIHKVQCKKQKQIH